MKIISKIKGLLQLPGLNYSKAPLLLNKFLSKPFYLPLCMFICRIIVNINNARIIVGTICVKYGLSKILNALSAPNSSWTAKKIKAIISIFQGLSSFLLWEILNKDMAIMPATKDKNKFAILKRPSRYSN